MRRRLTPITPAGVIMDAISINKSSLARNNPQKQYYGLLLHNAL